MRWSEQVRRFNRAVTQRVGALDDHYLARDRPLAEARVLWEIGPDGCEVRGLRGRLGLDPVTPAGCSARSRRTGWWTVGPRAGRTAACAPRG